MSKSTSKSNSSRKLRRSASYLTCGSVYRCSWTYPLENGQQSAKECGEMARTAELGREDVGWQWASSKYVHK